VFVDRQNAVAVTRADRACTLARKSVALHDPLEAFAD
jgi:hypothetical protein